jgi:integrase/recombinase XerC
VTDHAALWESLARSWSRSLRARNLSPATTKKYGESLGQLIAYLAAHEDVAPSQVKRRHVEEYIGFVVENRSASTASVRYRSLQQFFKWAVDEEECASDPMKNMRPPAIPEIPVPIVTDAQLSALLKACSGKSFASLRDTAIIRLFMDTGLRLAELSNIRLTDMDFDLEVVTVLGKNRRPRSVPYASKTAQALDRYLRSRAGQPFASSPNLWLGDRGKGPLTHWGVGRVIKRRGQEIGLAELHPHQFRHTAAHQWLANGGNETDAMRLFGWKSRQMLNRYGASAADERAVASARRLALGDRL